MKANEQQGEAQEEQGRSGDGDPDLEFVLQAQDGDGKAYEELVRRHQRRVFNVAYRILGDYDEALDISQDAFIQAYRSIGGFRREARFTSWVLTIAVNLCRNRLKYWKRRARNRTRSMDEPIRHGDSEIVPELPDERPSSLDALSAQETGKIIREEIMELPEEYRSVLVLREMQEMSYDEVSEILGIAAGTVKSRLHRGRMELRGRLRRRLSLPGDDGQAKAATGGMETES